MAINLDHPMVLLVMRKLYKGPLRASKVAEETNLEQNLTWNQVQEILHALNEHGLVLNIEKNKSNGEAVYKLTRAGEARLEEMMHSSPRLNQSPGHQEGIV
ncbi:MAG: hypothetical protein ACUVV6_01225 [Thermoplasmatota archaeon]